MEFVLLSLMLGGTPIVSWVVATASFHRLRRKGYSATGASFVLLTCLLPSVVTGVVAVPEPSQVSSFLYGPLYLVVLPGALFISGVIAAAAVLPARSGRKYGPRGTRLPFIMAGYGFFGAAVAALAGSIWIWSTGQRPLSQVVSGVIVTVAMLFPLGRYFLRRAAQLAREQTSTVDRDMRADGRAAVLYLRAFAQEAHPFAHGDASKYGAYSQSWEGEVAGAGQPIDIPFEQFFGPGIEQAIGPFVALGSPEDVVPPHGARRFYATDDSWKTELARLAAGAQVIVAEVSASDNLRWELEYLRQQGLQTKLYLFTPHDDRSAVASRTSVGRFLGRLRGLVPPIPWPVFAADLGTMGYRLSPVDPGPGALITFDGAGHSVLLTTEADFPDEFIGVMTAWLSHRVQVGRCVPVTCDRCQQATHVRSESKGMGSVLCRRCRAPHRDARRTAAGLLAIASGMIGGAIAGGVIRIESLLGGNQFAAEHPYLVLGVGGLVVLFIIFLLVPDERPPA